MKAAVSHQYHADFKVFSGPTLEHLKTVSAGFLRSVAAKSISVFRLGPDLYLTIGYSKRADPCPTAIDYYELDISWVGDELGNVLSAGAGARDTICHSILNDLGWPRSGIFMVVLYNAEEER